MAVVPNHRREFIRALLRPALLFLLLPVGAVGFSRYGERKLDSLILDGIERNVRADARGTEAEREAFLGLLRANPPSQACGGTDEALAEYRGVVCAAFGDVWQFLWAERLAWLGIALAVFTLALIAALGWWAWRRPSALYVAFMTGWRAVVALVAVDTVVQAVLAVWLSYWVTALLLNSYVPKLILLVVVLGGMAVWAVLKTLFARPPERSPVAAEVVAEADAPVLWRRVRELAGRLGTRPPDVIVAGIDDAFFVTEAGLGLESGQALSGRVLYLSLPLLRVLSPSEADAVFSHELAHFRGGDTEATAKLAPELTRFGQYHASLVEGGVTIPAAHVLRLFRAAFELGLKKEQRRRELEADAQAVKLTSADDLARSLLKVTGYSAFRSATEATLFAQRDAHTAALGIQARVEAGLPAHVASQGFLEQVKAQAMPHPFDSHPPLEERLGQVSTTVRVEDVVRVFDVKPERTWADEVLTGAAVEGRLWSQYEGRFKREHERSLAYRYLPATDAERAHVLRFFPDVSFPTKAGKVLVTYLGVTLPDEQRFFFRDVEAAKVDDGTFSKQLVVTVKDPSGGKSRKVKVNLGQLKPHAERFQATFATYWGRDQTARQLQGG